MKNNFFRFKQFTIQQEGAGMKVTTEGCLFGALVIFKNPLTILDAGSGTGLLSLMLAQRFSESIITAIDIDTTAIALTKQNFNDSPFTDRLATIFGDYGTISNNLLFDAIVCNPPFYNKGFLSPNHQRNIAMRDGSNLNNVLQLFSNNLHLNGQGWILLPLNEQKEFEMKARAKNLYCVYKIHIENKPGKPFRIISMFMKSEAEYRDRYICICNQDGAYTQEFKQLLKDFYLAF